MSDETYNGWKNYETRNVNLWLDNEEWMYRDLVRLTKRAIVGNEDDPAEATDELTTALGHYVRERWEDNGAQFGDLAASDGDSLANVDWEEIASAWVETWIDES